jgi:hypothetical protein
MYQLPMLFIFMLSGSWQTNLLWPIIQINHPIYEEKQYL